MSIKTICKTSKIHSSKCTFLCFILHMSCSWQTESPKQLLQKDRMPLFLKYYVKSQRVYKTPTTISNVLLQSLKKPSPCPNRSPSRWTVNLSPLFFVRLLFPSQFMNDQCCKKIWKGRRQRGSEIATNSLNMSIIQYKLCPRHGHNAL